jgi:SAM-dependent methyltransferase
MENSLITKPVQQNDWYKYWFDTAFYKKLYSRHNQQEASDFVDYLICQLEPALDSKMLDLGCGNGRHSRSLASKGFDVTGIDLAASSIQEARRYETPSMRFFRKDMRLPFGRNCFDYVFSFFTSFGYFNDSSDDQRIMNNISSSLKDNGCFVIDYINSAYAEQHLIRKEEKEIDGIHYHITRSTDSMYIRKNIQIEDCSIGVPLKYAEQVKKLSLEDFELLFKTNHLQLLNVFGDYQLNDYHIDTSPRLIMIARKIK